MNVKIAIQFLILLILLVFLFFFIKNSFLSENQNVIDLTSDKNIRTSELDLKENISNIIENLNYKSFDGRGNEYILTADFGEISDENEDIIILKKVNGIIKLKDKSHININADFAKYNSKNFDTYFYTNVVGTFEDNKIHCENLDLLVKDSLAVLYNNINFLNYDLTAKADRILLNLLNGDVNIKMFDKENKIQIIKK
tara:strand:- start:2321 stop:2914 length:594 start_codon:yes stop_codon:yes gene_type:complete